MITPIPEKELPKNNSAVSRLVDINKTHFNNAGVYYYQVKSVKTKWQWLWRDMNSRSP